MDELRAAAVHVDEAEDAIEAYTLCDGRRLLLIGGEKMFNLTGRAPKGNSTESMDLGFTLQALSLQLLARKPGLAPGPHPVPHDINVQAARRMLAVLSE